MYLHELVPYEGLDLVVANDETSHVLVLTPNGAVFQNEFTEDLTNFSIAFGLLITSNKWRIAKTAEVEKMRNQRADDYMMELIWRDPQPKPALTIVRSSEL